MCVSLPFCFKPHQEVACFGGRLQRGVGLLLPIGCEPGRLDLTTLLNRYPPNHLPYFTSFAVHFICSTSSWTNNGKQLSETSLSFLLAAAGHRFACGPLLLLPFGVGIEKRSKSARLYIKRKERASPETPNLSTRCQIACLSLTGAQKLASCMRAGDEFVRARQLDEDDGADDDQVGRK